MSTLERRLAALEARAPHSNLADAIRRRFYHSLAKIYGVPGDALLPDEDQTLEHFMAVLERVYGSLPDCLA